MAELKIEAREKYLDHGAELGTKLDPKNVEVKIFDGENLVAETTLESLVQKFLVISSEHAQAMALLGMIEENHKERSKIIMPGQET